MKEWRTYLNLLEILVTLPAAREQKQQRAG